MLPKDYFELVEDEPKHCVIVYPYAYGGNLNDWKSATKPSESDIAYMALLVQTFSSHYECNLMIT